MSLSHDVAFSIVICENVRLAQHIVDRVFGEGAYKILQVSNQHELRSSLMGRAARLDFIGRCRDGTLINIEIQKSHTEDVARKFRFYRALIDANQANVGDELSAMNPLISIFIVDAPFDDGVELLIVNMKHVGRDTGPGILIGELSATDPSEIAGGPMREALQFVLEEGRETMWIEGVKGGPRELLNSKYNEGRREATAEAAIQGIRSMH